MFKNLEEIRNDITKLNIIFGAGKKGEETLAYLKKNDVEVTAFIDNDSDKWSMIYHNRPVWDIDKFYSCKSEQVRIFIGCMDFVSVSKQLEENGFKNYYYYHDDCIYDVRRENINTEKLKKEIYSRPIYIYGDEKFILDFTYIFDDLQIIGYVDGEGNNSISLKQWKSHSEKNSLIIVCKFNHNEALNKLGEIGLQENKDFIIADAVFNILDENCTKPVYILPSQMMKKTVYAQPEKQDDCYNPFTNMRVGTKFTVHCCCTDWTLPIGSLEENTMDEIWNSIYAKIFRLSVINKTYSFCKHDRCTHLKIDTASTDRRMEVTSIGKYEYPSYIEIGIDRTCNFYCTSCRKELMVMNSTQLNRVEKIKNEIINSGYLEKTEKLLVGGSGEPLFSKIERDIILKNLGQRKTILIRTNGILLNEELFNQLDSIYEKIGIIVSIDAATKETYNKLRKSNNLSNWDILQGNLQVLSEKKKEGKISLFQINICVQKGNYKEIPDFIRMGINLDVDCVYITPIRNFGTFTKEEFQDIRIMDDAKQIKPEVKVILEDEITKDRRVLMTF